MTEYEQGISPGRIFQSAGSIDCWDVQRGVLVAEGSRVLYRSKISFACMDQEIKGALEPHVSADLLYASLGGTKPDDSYSFDRLDTLMRSLDKVRAFPPRKRMQSGLRRRPELKLHLCCIQ